MRPWLCSNDHPREAGGTSVTHIANAHRTTIARPTKLPTFLLYSTVPVAQSAAVSLNLGTDSSAAAIVTTGRRRGVATAQERKIAQDARSFLKRPRIYLPDGTWGRPNRADLAQDAGEGRASVRLPVRQTAGGGAAGVPLLAALLRAQHRTYRAEAAPGDSGSRSMLRTVRRWRGRAEGRFVAPKSVKIGATGSPNDRFFGGDRR